jgi:hypothetical protein
MSRRTLIARAAQGAAAFAAWNLAESLAAAAPRAAIRRYEYLFPDGALEVYDIDRGFSFVKRNELPTERGVRGACACARTSSLYVSYGSDRSDGKGSLLKYDLHHDRVVWTRDYPFGIDSMAITPDGRKVFMPEGELASGGTWYVLAGTDGRVIGQIAGGSGPHNTIVSRDGRRVYLGARSHDELLVADTSTYKVIKRIGPLASSVRPFTIDAAERIAYTTATGLLGFQVSNIRTGRVLHTVGFKGFSWDPKTFPASAPSHGISLSPDGTTLYVLDAPNAYVHVFDVRRVLSEPPRMVASVRLSGMSGEESSCAYDCLRDGWISHTRDGRFVLVGDAGDVIRSATRRVAKHLPTLANTRKYIEVVFDGSGRVVWAATSRSSIGYRTPLGR